MSEQKLPMADGQGAEGGTPPPLPIQVSNSALRLIGTLAIAGALAGGAIVMSYQWARPRIEAYQARMLAEAVTEVLGGAQRYETVFLENGTFTATPQADTAGLDRVYVGYDADGRPKGIAITAAEAGFQDVIDLIFGYDPPSGDVLGMKVLESKETPGLGDKITRDSAFIGEFDEVGTPLLGVKKGQGNGGHDEVVMITGATISSRAVIGIINHRLDAVKGPVNTYWTSSLASASTGDAPAPTPDGSTPKGSTSGGGA